MPAAVLPPVLHEPVSTPSTEWAKETKEALGQPSSRAPTTGGATTTTPGADFPGSYPRNATASDTAEDLNPAELVSKATGYFPNQEQVTRAVQNAGHTAAQVVASISSYLPTSTASENNNTHVKASSSQGVMGAHPEDSGKTTGELNETPNDARFSAETPLKEPIDVAIPEIGGGAQNHAAVGPTSTTPDAFSTSGPPIASEAHPGHPAAALNASPHETLSAQPGDRTVLGLGTVAAASNHSSSPLSKDVSSSAPNASRPAAQQLDDHTLLGAKVVDTGSNSAVENPVASTDPGDRQTSASATGTDGRSKAKELGSVAAGGLGVGAVTLGGTAAASSHDTNDTEEMLGTSPESAKPFTAVADLNASEGIAPRRFEDKDDAKRSSGGFSAPESSSGGALPAESSKKGNVPEGGSGPVKFGLGDPANDEQGALVHGTDANTVGHAPRGKEDGQRNGADGALAGAGVGAAVGMGAATMRTQAHDRDSQPSVDGQRSGSAERPPTPQTKAPGAIGRAESFPKTSSISQLHPTATLSEKVLAREDHSLKDDSTTKLNDLESGTKTDGEAKAITTGNQPSARQNDKIGRSNVNKTLATAGAGGVAGLGAHRLRDDTRERSSSREMRDQVDNSVHNIGTIGGVPAASGSTVAKGTSRSSTGPQKSAIENDKVKDSSNVAKRDENAPSKHQSPTAMTNDVSKGKDDHDNSASDAEQPKPHAGETKSGAGAQDDKIHAQGKQEATNDSGHVVGNASDRDGKDHDREHSKGNEPSGHRRATFMERVKGEVKIIAGKFGGHSEKVEEGRKMKSGEM